MTKKVGKVLTWPLGDVFFPDKKKEKPMELPKVPSQEEIAQQEALRKEEERKKLIRAGEVMRNNINTSALGDTSNAPVAYKKLLGQ